MPGPISQTLLDSDLRAAAKGLQLYPKVLSVAHQFLSPPGQDTVPPDQLVLRPQTGRFAYHASPPAQANDLVTFYHYGFPSEIGAGPYDRRIGTLHIPSPGRRCRFPDRRAARCPRRPVR